MVRLLPSIDVRRFIDRLRTGAWFVPATIVAACAALAVGLSMLSEQIDAPTLTDDPSAASTLVATAATATVTFAGLTFSISIVALQLTSSQFSPRVLRQFLRSWPSQISLGTFAGAFLYDLIILSRIRTGADAFVPSLSLGVALVIAVATVVTFVLFVSHISRAIRVVNIIDGVTKETRRAAAALPRREDGDPEHVDVVADLALASVVTHPGPGVVLQHLDRRKLAALAAERNGVLQIVPEVGDFLTTGAEIARFWARPDTDTSLEWKDMAPYVGCGAERTMTSDVAFGYRQLVDIAAKALSPGVNDPTTAVQCIDRLHDLLRVEATCRGSRSVERDDDDAVRLLLPTVSFVGLVTLSFDEIRLFTGTSIQVSRRLMAALDDLDSVAGPNGKETIARLREQLDRAVRANFDDWVDQRAAGVADAQGIGSESDTDDDPDDPDVDDEDDGSVPPDERETAASSGADGAT